MQRHRLFRNTEVPLSYDWAQQNGSGSIAVGFDYDKDEMWDVVTPNYREIISNGGYVNNPMVHSKSTLQSGSGSRMAINKSDPSIWQSANGDVTGYLAYADAVSYLDIDIDVAALRKIGILSATAAIDKTPYAFGEDLAEIAKAIELMRNPLNTALETAETLRKNYLRSYKSTRRLSKQLRTGRNVPSHLRVAMNLGSYAGATLAASSQAWLQSRFVYGTTIRSIMNAHEAAMTRPKQAVVTRKTSRGYYSDTQYNSDSVWNANHTRQYERTCAVSLSGRISILYEDTCPTQSWRDHLGLRVKDVPHTMWQVVPYSWALDRFLNLSQSLQALQNLLDPSVKVRVACDRLTTIKRQTLRHSFDADTVYNVTLDGNTKIFDQHIVNRSPITVSLTDAVPMFNYRPAVSSISSIADLSALAYSKLYKAFR